MGVLMYRQRPSSPALISACAVLIIGMLMVLALKQEEVPFQTLLLTGYITLCLAAMLLVIAFARYQFTHLWKHPDPSFSRNRATRRERGDHAVTE